MSNAVVFLLVLGVLALGLRTAARRLTGPSTRPEHVVHIDTACNHQTLTAHRFSLTGQPDYLLEENGEFFPMERKSRPPRSV
jgi:hypothetical protein